MISGFFQRWRPVLTSCLISIGMLVVRSTPFYWAALSRFAVALVSISRIEVSLFSIGVSATYVGKG